MASRRRTATAKRAAPRRRARPAGPGPAGSPPPESIRGRLRLDPGACVACRMCEYVCATGAIQFEELAEGVRLTIAHGSCAFCGLCAELCPTAALRVTAEWQLVHAPEESRTVAEIGLVRYFPCAACGTPLVPLAPALARRVWRAVNADMLRLQKLCRACRARASAEGLA